MVAKVRKMSPCPGGHHSALGFSGHSLAVPVNLGELQVKFLGLFTGIRKPPKRLKVTYSTTKILLACRSLRPL